QNQRERAGEKVFTIADVRAVAGELKRWAQAGAEQKPKQHRLADSTHDAIALPQETDQLAVAEGPYGRTRRGRGEPATGARRACVSRRSRRAAPRSVLVRDASRCSHL